MSILKRCCGYKGQHVCVDKYPDHMVPIEEFRKHPRLLHGVQDFCSMCQKVAHTIHNREKNYLRTVSYHIAGGFDKYYALPKEERKSIRDEAKATPKVGSKVVSLPRLSSIAPFSYPPEHEKRLRKDGKTTESAIKARKANRTGGFDYIMEHPAWPDIRKIGWTYDPPSRLSDFNVCCPYKSFSFPYISVYLENARLAESVVQEALKEYHVTGEWYRVSRELAIKTIEDYVESLNDREKQEVG